jgi:hypothetical protein
MSAIWLTKLQESGESTGDIPNTKVAVGLVILLTPPGSQELQRTLSSHAKAISDQLGPVDSFTTIFE